MWACVRLDVRLGLAFPRLVNAREHSGLQPFGWDRNRNVDSLRGPIAGPEPVDTPLQYPRRHRYHRCASSRVPAHGWSIGLG